MGGDADASDQEAVIGANLMRIDDQPMQEKGSLAPLLPALKSIAIFFLNLAAAVIGTAVVDSPFRTPFLPLAWSTRMRVEDGLSAVTAFAIGYFVFRRWKTDWAKWIWVAGVIWLARRLIQMWDGPSVFGGSYAVPPGLFWEFSNHTLPPDPESLNNWAQYWLVLLRTSFYSAGAFCCASYREAIE